MDASTSPPALPRPNGFTAPPGLASPKRGRKAKVVGAQPLLSTAPSLSSPRRSRKPKNLLAHSVLATAPENLLDEVHVLPPSPNRRARAAVLDRAKSNEAPLKVQMEGHYNFTAAKLVKKMLDPTQPVKKAPLLPDCHDWFKNLQPG